MGTRTSYTVPLIAGSSDIVAVPTFTRVLQGLAVVRLIVAALITWKSCFVLKGSDELEAEKVRIGHALASPTPDERQPA